MKATHVAGVGSPGRLLFVSDQLSSRRFLVDSGAAVSLFPVAALPKKRQPDSVSLLQAANGTSIATFGTVQLSLHLGLTKPLQWRFLVARVQQAVIGADFLQHYGFHIRMDTLTLLHPSTGTVVRGCSSLATRTDGKCNPVADALSRIDSSDIHSIEFSSIPFHQIAAAQAEDKELEQLRASPMLSFQPIVLPMSKDPVLCDMSTGSPRPYVPHQFRRDVFLSLHSFAHPGVNATQDLTTKHFLWPPMNRDIRQWTRACLACQRSKVTKHTIAPLQPFPQANGRFKHIHLDLVGLLPVSDGYRYLLTCID
ncbi:retroviral aspartyl protease [Trichuris suis]|nr:retroviral aspartyl protease [Trichuris suis]